MQKFKNIVVTFIPFLMFPSSSLKNFFVFFGLIYIFYAIFLASSWVGVTNLWAVIAIFASIFIILGIFLFSLLHYIIFVIKNIKNRPFIARSDFLWQSISALIFLFLIDRYIPIELNWSLYINKTADFSDRLMLGDYFLAKYIDERSRSNFREGDIFLYNDKNSHRLKIFESSDIASKPYFIGDIVAEPTYIIWSRDLNLVGGRINE